MSYRVPMAEPDRAPPAPGPYLQTVSGRWVNPFDPEPDRLDAGDIARSRGGDAEDVFAALMHDASEAYLGDMPDSRILDSCLRPPSTRFGSRSSILDG